MRETNWTVATLVTVGRLAFLPVLWGWALEGRAAWVGAGVMASFLADVLDGQLARRLKQVTRLGSQLDSLADGLLEASSAVWLGWFRPELFAEPYRAATGLALASWLLAAGAGLLRFRRFLNLHLYSGKASGVVGACFVLDALAVGFHAPLFYLAALVFTLANLEALVILLTRSQVDEHIGSILRRPVGAAQ